MSVAEEAPLYKLKVVINKQKTKVLFAEVGSDFAVDLLGFLTCPLGVIVRILRERNGDGNELTIGSLTTLYHSVQDLKIDCFCTSGCKQRLLYPSSSFEAHIGHTEYYVCENWPCDFSNHHPLKISTEEDIDRCDCGKSLQKRIAVAESSEKAPAVADDDGVFFLKNESFLISDDLQIVPNVEGSVLETLMNLGITDMDGAELRDVSFGFNEYMELLKGSLLSRAPLSDVILGKGEIDSTTTKYEPVILFNGMAKEVASNSRKMIVKVMIQKSTNKLLFAQAENDFVDFLLSLLTIPLGGVEKLLGGKTFLNNIDNLYRSLESINGDKFMRNPDKKSRLLNPKMPHGYVSKNHIFPLVEEIPPQIYHHIDKKTGKNWFSYSNKHNKLWGKATEHRNGRGEYVKGPTMYMVTDDLIVTPLCMSSVFNVLNEWEIPLSDVKEVVLPIGLEEGLNILKASLTSTTALTDGLIINPMFKKHFEMTRIDDTDSSQSCNYSRIKIRRIQ